MRIVAVLLMMTGMAFAANVEQEVRPPDPDEIWLNPIWLKVETNGKRPKSMSVSFRLTINEGHFREVCEYVPQLIDALNIELNRDPHPRDAMTGRNRTNFSLMATRLIKSLVPDRKGIYAVEVAPALPDKMTPEQRDTYNKCNRMPQNIVK